MCGIVGTIGYKDRKILEIMNESQKHRGPDDEGLYWEVEEQLGLAMRRLSIVDLDNGSQPMTNEDNSVIVVYNGEIFNAPILRKELVAKNHRFNTINSDTEVLVHLYEEYGVNMLNYLNGMFAFAVYDKRKKKVLLARDHMGIKPLHYQWDENEKRFAFASEMKSILQAGISEKKINADSLQHYLSFQCVPAPNSIYEDIQVLPAAHYLLLDLKNKEIDIKRYWNCYNDRVIYSLDKREIEEYLETNIENAIQRWTMSDVPIACSLSGGLDSAIIAATLSKKRAIHTYTLGFQNNEKHDERELARKLAKMYGTQHEEIVITEDDVMTEFSQIIHSLDSPYAGGIPSWFVCRAVSGKQKVLFNGTGGDELFGNYGKWLRYEHPLVRLQMIKKYLSWGESIGNILKYPNGSIYHKYIPDNMKKQILMSQYMTKQNSNKLCEEIFAQCDDSWRMKIPYLDFEIQLPEEFLMMIDRFSMHFSIEARVPFLDRELVEKVMGVSPIIRTKRYEYKYLLKSIASKLLPEEYLSAPKHGFVLPYQEWLQGRMKPLVIDLCTGDFVKTQNIFNNDLENKLIKPFYEGRKDLTPLVWTILMFQLWHSEKK